MRTRAIAAAVAICLTPTGCAAVISALPTVIAYVTDAGQILDAIAAFLHTFFQNHPDPGKQADAERALSRCRVALNVALRAAEGTQDLHQEDADAAFTEFRQAYSDLLAIVEPLGVHPQKAGSFSVSMGGLTVPEPLAVGPVKVHR